jgi:hypothetical protein
LTFTGGGGVQPQDVEPLARAAELRRAAAAAATTKEAIFMGYLLGMSMRRISVELDANCNRNGAVSIPGGLLYVPVNGRFTLILTLSVP